MTRIGYIQSDLDLKLLILYIMDRAAAPITFNQLLELALCDAGVDYFSLTQAVSHLVETEHLTLEDEHYTITEKGIRNSDTVESSLPYSVRSKASKLVAPIEEKMRRAAMITAKHSVNDDGCFVQLALSDGKGEIFNLRLLVADEAQANVIEKNFRDDAENYYLRIAELLSEK